METYIIREDVFPCFYIDMTYMNSIIKIWKHLDFAFNKRNRDSKLNF